MRNCGNCANRYNCYHILYFNHDQNRPCIDYRDEVVIVQPTVATSTGQIDIFKQEELRIIDFVIKGNAIKLFLGSPDEKGIWAKEGTRDREYIEELVQKGEMGNRQYWGDDWDDVPYEHNAGEVYDDFVKGVVVLHLKYNALALEPCEGEFNSRWCKDDMADRKVPCVVAYDNSNGDIYDYDADFKTINANDKAVRIYFGDKLTDVIKQFREKGDFIIAVENLQL